MMQLSLEHSLMPLFIVTFFSKGDKEPITLIITSIYVKLKPSVHAHSMKTISSLVTIPSE